MDEALRAEARQQPLGDALLEVQVDRVVGEYACVLEDDRPDRCLAAPVGELLARARGARSVSSVAAQLGSVAARRSSGGKVQTCRPSPSRASASGSASRSSSAAGERVAKRLGVEANPPSRPFEQIAAAVDLLAKIVLALARVLKLLGGDLLAPGIEVSGLDLASEPLDVGVPDTAAEPALDVVVDHLRQAAELALDRLGLAHEHLEDAVLGALREDEVVAADLRRGLELAIDAAVALLDAAGVPRHVEVEEVGAVGLEVEALASGVGRDQDAERILGGSVLKRRLISLRASPLVRPVMTAIRSSARSVASIACSSDRE